MNTSESTYIYSAFDEKFPFIFLLLSRCDASTPVFSHKNLRNINKLCFSEICIQVFCCQNPAFHSILKVDEHQFEFIDVEDMPHTLLHKIPFLWFQLSFAVRHFRWQGVVLAL